MNKLPDEILDIIWSHYWGFIYSENVIEQLKKPKYEINKITEFFRKKFIRNKCDEYDKQITYYLENMNVSLTELNKDKGLKLLCKINYTPLKYCFDCEYSQSCFHNVRDELKQIAIFSIIFNNPILRYKLLHRFTKL